MFGQIFTNGEANMPWNEAELCIFLILYPSSPFVDKLRVIFTDAASLIKFITHATVIQIAACKYLYWSFRG